MHYWLLLVPKTSVSLTLMRMRMRMVMMKMRMPEMGIQNLKWEKCVAVHVDLNMGMY